MSGKLTQREHLQLFIVAVLNGFYMFAKTFKLLDVFPHEGFSSVMYLFMLC